MYAVLTLSRWLADNGSPADKIAADLAKEFGVKVGSYKMPAESSSAIDEAVALITKEMGEVSLPAWGVMSAELIRRPICRSSFLPLPRPYIDSSMSLLPTLVSASTRMPTR